MIYNIVLVSAIHQHIVSQLYPNTKQIVYKEKKKIWTEIKKIKLLSHLLPFLVPNLLPCIIFCGPLLLV